MKDKKGVNGIGVLVPFKDTRNNPPVSVQSSDVAKFPYSSVASVSYKSRYVGSAFLLSESLVMSVGHVFSNQNYTSVSDFSIRFQGAGVAVGVTNIYLHPEYDLALVSFFPRKVILNSFRLELARAGDEILVVGFPSMGKGVRQYYGSGVVKRVGGDDLIHNASTRDGHSGSPIILRSQFGTIVGVHRGSSEFPDENLGVAVNSKIEEWVINHLNQY